MEIKKEPKVIRDLFEKGIWSTRNDLFDKIREARKLNKRLMEQEETEPEKPSKIAPDLVSQIQSVLQKYGVKSSRSFLGWELSGGISDDRSFLSLGVREDGFCLISKSGSFTLSESKEAQSRLIDILSCLTDLEEIAPNIVAK